MSVSVQDHEKTKTSICTFLSVLVHFNIILPKVKDEVKSCNQLKQLSPCVLTLKKTLYLYVS